MHDKKFATAINCMDGRVQLPVNDWIKKEFKVDFVDTITEPGPNKILAGNNEGAQSIKNRVLISVNKHGSRQIAIIGHHDCAGNPVDKATQVTHISGAIKTIQSWDLGITVVGLWVDENLCVNKI